MVYAVSLFFYAFFDFYADEREQMDHEAQMTRGKFEPIATIEEKRISAVLKTPWATDGKDFSARLRNNREQLASTLQSELTRALIIGADSASVAKIIAKKMNAACVIQILTPIDNVIDFNATRIGMSK